MARLSVPVTSDDHVQGDPQAPFTLVEYGDYECPHCGSAHPIIKSVIDQMGKQLRFVYRHFPLTQIHPNAELAAQAAEAASAQGKFWEMHDMLYKNQDHLNLNTILEIVSKLELDQGLFQHALEHGLYQARVRSDFLSGVKSGVNGTPSLFINEERHEGPVEASRLIAAIKAANNQIHVTT